MRDWLHNLPVVWMTLAVFAVTYVLAGVIFAVVNLLAVEPIRSPCVALDHSARLTMSALMTLASSTGAPCLYSVRTCSART